MYYASITLPTTCPITYTLAAYLCARQSALRCLLSQGSFSLKHSRQLLLLLCMLLRRVKSRLMCSFRCGSATMHCAQKGFPPDTFRPALENSCMRCDNGFDLSLVPSPALFSSLGPSGAFSSGYACPLFLRDETWHVRQRQEQLQQLLLKPLALLVIHSARPNKLNWMVVFPTHQLQCSWWWRNHARRSARRIICQGGSCSDSLIILPKKAARCTARVREGEGGGRGRRGWRVCASADGDSPGRAGIQPSHTAAATNSKKNAQCY